MTPLGVLLGMAVCGAVAACEGGPSSPSGCCVELVAEGKVGMIFTPQEPKFTQAAEVYRQLWADEGTMIVEAMERGTGLTFQETHVSAVIFEGPSQSGFGDRPMYLRAS